MRDENLKSIDEPTGPSLPDCPLCGQAVVTVTILGPTTAVAAPCGCRAPPEVVLVDPAVASAGDTGDAPTNTDADTGRG
ncbi:hypothetical protein [Natrialba sp. PRR66]|uniref:hypothetical protein n=1 Tax=Natrialba sp. PRR66 TaxID=3098146 RepID=UPI002B1DA74C|nr:hypothetical protein [Natrialba sp. PRR66]